MPTPPGYTICESTAVLGVGTVLSPFADTTGFTHMFLEGVIANSTGTTPFTIEGSFDGTTMDATMPYTPAVTAPSGAARAAFRDPPLVSAARYPYVNARRATTHFPV